MLALLVLALAAAAAAVRADATTATTVATPASLFSGGDMQCAGECRRRRMLRTAHADDDLTAPRRTAGQDGAQDLDDGAQANATGLDDPAHDKQVLPDNAARMTEDLDEEDDEEEKMDVAVAEGRAQSKRRQSLKIRKVDGAVLQMLLMLKMMPVMFISTKVAILSFLVQLKSLMLSLVSAGIAAVQFFWRFQEKRQRMALQGGHAAALGAGGQGGGWEHGEHGMWPDRRKYIQY